MQIRDPEAFRTNVRSLLDRRLGDGEKCVDMEKGVYNWSLRQATSLGVVKRWDNPAFVRIYADRVRTVACNVAHPTLRERVLSGKIKAHRVAFASHQEMMPERWRDLLTAKKLKDESRYAPRLEASTDNFTCYKCKSRKCSYYQLQTRSADEPMTTFVTCLDCGNRWKC
jgi:transcription elongation factor S-II